MMAMLFMLCDHMWATVVPAGNDWLTCIGRLAYPIFAFQISESFAHVPDDAFKKFIGKMFIWALITEIPFDLMYGGTWFYPFHQNVLFTYVIALALMWIAERARRKHWLAGLLAFIACMGIGYVLGYITFVDYYGCGIMMVLMFWYFRHFRCGWIAVIAGMVWINGFLLAGYTYDITLFGTTFAFPQQAFALLALIPIFLYNGQRGRDSKVISFCCYAFYPAHILILYLISRFILISA